MRTDLLLLRSIYHNQEQRHTAAVLVRTLLLEPCARGGRRVGDKAILGPPLNPPHSGSCAPAPRSAWQVLRGPRRSNAPAL